MSRNVARSGPSSAGGFELLRGLEEFEMKGHIVANIRLYPTGDGGRAGPTPSDKWGCLLVVADIVLDCRLLLAGVEKLAPGDKATVPIVFLSPDLARNYLAVGTGFTLREARVVGEGEVVSTDFPAT